MTSDTYTAITCPHRAGGPCPSQCPERFEVQRERPPLYGPRRVKVAKKEIVMPKPEIMARPAQEAEMPIGARKLVRLLTELDWEVRVTYARGPNYRGQMVDSILVRGLDRPFQGISAEWWDGSAAGGAISNMEGVRMVSDHASIIAFVKGRTIEPTPRQPCLVCGREVRVKKDGSPFKHTCQA